MPPDLSGHTVVLTRAEHQLGAARKLFEAAGAQVLDLPALVIGPPDSWAHSMMPSANSKISIGW